MSFRRRLTLFFLLIVVLPMIAVGVAVVQVSGESSTGKSDARLAAGLETALAFYDEQVAAAERAVGEAARDPAVAVLQTERSIAPGALGQVAQESGLRALRIRAPGGRELAAVGPRPQLAVAEVELQGRGGAVGTLVGTVTTPTRFVTRIRQLTGRPAAISTPRDVLATTRPVGDLALPAPGEGRTVERDGAEERAVSASLQNTPLEARLTLFGPLESGGIAATRPLVAAALAVFFAIALIFIAMLLRTLQGQVAAMLDAARRIGGGDFSRRVPAQGGDELAGLAREFNKMSGRLEAQMDELRRQRVELDQSVRRIGEAFASGLDRRALLQIVAETALSACEADYAEIAISGAERIDAGERPAGESEEALAEAIENAGRSATLAESARGNTHALAHPLRAVGTDGTVAGVMAVARPADRPFSEEQRGVLRYLIGQASVSIENIGLHELVAEQAVTDELTGLPNNRGFRTWIETEVARAERFGHELSLLMLDIDDFKGVNDTYGHLQGDEVLRMLGGVLRRESRNIDQPARYGGEEFAIALPETGLDGAVEVAERVRATIQGTEVPLVEGDGSIRVTASVGAATLPRAAADLRGLISAADEALYRAKRRGKNRVEAWRDGGGEGPPPGQDGEGREPEGRGAAAKPSA